MPNTAPPPAGLAPREAVPSATLTLLDKQRFVQWAGETHRLTALDHAVLQVVVHRLLGLGRDCAPHNGWTTNGVLATAVGATKRGVRKSLGRLQAWGLLTRCGIPGRGGRIVLHVPGVVGAAAQLKLSPLGDGTARGSTSKWRRRGHPVDGGASASKRGTEGPLSRGEKGNQETAKRGTAVPLNPVEDPKEKNLNPLEGARGTAAEPDAAPRPVVDEGQEGPPATGLQPGLQEGTLARARLLARLNGIAAKMGRKAGAELLHQLGEDKVQRWLRLQRERCDAQLVKEAVGVLASWLGVDRKQLGEAVATQQGPRYTPPPPKRPLASPRPLQPASLHEAAKTRQRAEAWDPEALRASAMRLGMIPKDPTRLNGAGLR
jgi:hypothetical protein